MTAKQQKNQIHIWAKKLAAISQNGLNFTRDPYDKLRFADVREIAAEMLARGAGVPPAQIIEVLAGEGGYATPKVDVRGVVFRRGKILLVREKSDHRWTLPGGWADVGESPAECVVREIREESGFAAKTEKLLAVFDREKHGHRPKYLFHIYKLFFRCKIIGGRAKPGEETDAVRFFSADALPELSLPRVTAEQIAHFFQHAENPDWPASFDRE